MSGPNQVYNSRTRIFNRALLLGVVCTLGLIGLEVVANGGGQPNFQGATEGVPVVFEAVPLPAVTGSPAAAFRAQNAAGPFAPGFCQLVSGEIVITSNAEMRFVWHRLFHEPYDPSLFDFDSTFVVMLGNGLQHPYFGFEIANVEQVTATFQSGDTYLEYPLAIVGRGSCQAHHRLRWTQSTNWLPPRSRTTSLATSSLADRSWHCRNGRDESPVKRDHLRGKY